jgi:hypothetical protein
VISFSSASLEPARALAAVGFVGLIGFILDRSLAAARAAIIYWQASVTPLA